MTSSPSSRSSRNKKRFHDPLNEVGQDHPGSWVNQKSDALKGRSLNEFAPEYAKNLLGAFSGSSKRIHEEIRKLVAALKERRLDNAGMIMAGLRNDLWDDAKALAHLESLKRGVVSLGHGRGGRKSTKRRRTTINKSRSKSRSRTKSRKSMKQTRRV
jgi:hypothetical protein